MILDIALVLTTSLWLLAMYCIFFNKKLGHKIFGWHYVTSKTGFDGASMTGTCDHCKKRVLQDSQGNWF